MNLYEYIKEFIKDKKVLIAGYGREGMANFSACEKAGGYSSLDVCDMNESITLPCGHRLICGERYLDSMNDYDLVFKSPGIVLPNPVESYQCVITSQTDIFMTVFREQIIGITGTKGKSTTSSFIHHLLISAGKDAILGGNIGIPVFGIADEINEDAVVVMELSCHQLEYASVSPAKAIYLNLYEEHLDHYGTFDKYRIAKEHIYYNQLPSDYLFAGENVIPQNGSYKSNLTVIRNHDSLPFTSLEDIGASLRGEHNMLDLAFAYEISKLYGITDAVFTEAVRTFKPLAHRLSPIGTKDGITYIDDSISTTPFSAISALKAYPNTGVLLLGGMDRGIDYVPIAAYLKETVGEIDYIVLMYESGKRILAMLEDNAALMEHVVYIEELKEACEFAAKNCAKGKAVLLSPAAASYGYFKNFEERGDKFKEYALFS